MPAQPATCAIAASATGSTRGSPAPSTPPRPSAGDAGTGTSTNTFSPPAGATVGSVPLACTRRSTAAPGWRPAARMSPKSAPQSRAKNSGVVLQLAADAPRTPSIASTALGPGSRLLQYRAEWRARRRQQLRLGVVQVGRAHHDVRADRRAAGRPVRVRHAGDPRGRAVGRRMRRPRRSGSSARPPRRPARRCASIDPGEAAPRVQHAVGEVEVAHQVVHARRVVRRGAQEHGRVAEDLPQPRVLDGRARRSGPAAPRAAGAAAAGGASTFGSNDRPSARSRCRGTAHVAGRTSPRAESR